MDSFLIAALQMNSQPDAGMNLARAERMVEEAVEKKARCVLLPENFAFLGDDTEKHRQAESIERRVMQEVPQWAARHRIYVMAGGFPARADSGKVYNRSVMFGPDGALLAQYDKIHLFDISLSVEESYRESELVEAGRIAPVVCHTSLGERKSSPYGGARFGLSICYDVRFPELYRELAGQHADVLCVPSAFTRPTGEAHWEVLLRARAIENTAYVAAPAQTGLHGESRTTHGHSMIIDPWGNILADAGTDTGVIMAAIDLNLIRETRKKLPSLQHRKL
ncbi:carbon-nitrogen hydrolase family protein [Balneolales bacterium ANBcel1]|nr:carbon-nitrogen hydrolase family protein [Balneolales bacterium ANBcel1]